MNKFPTEFKKFDPANISSNDTVRVRFAPSPTGALHIGGARTALYSWLQAAKAGSQGKFVLRIEDTDRERSTDANTEQILDALNWLGITWDEGPFSQLDSLQAQKEAVQKLLQEGKAYYDKSGKPEVDAWKEKHGKDRGYRGDPDPSKEGAIRLRIPEGTTVVRDLIRGDIVFDNSHIDDFVIARGDGSVLYNFAVAWDDAEMGITHVIRGDDHVSNTPKQQLITEVLGKQAPAYAHVPLLHNMQGKKMSKRDGAASVQILRDAGYLPEAIRNYIALLGWGPDSDETVLRTPELIDAFDVSDVRSSPARFDEKKLRWLNGIYMRELEPEVYAQLVADYTGLELDDKLRAACELVQPKAQTLADVQLLIRFLYEEPTYDTEGKDWRKIMKPPAREVLSDSLALLTSLESFDHASIEAVIKPLAEKHDISLGKTYQPLRLAISGGGIGPGLFESLELLGKDKTLQRIENTLKL